MKRQMKLIMLILQHVEQANGMGNIPLPEFKDYSKSEVQYHVILCEEASYIKVLKDGKDGSGKPVYIQRLTWRGHEELESLRNQFET